MLTKDDMKLTEDFANISDLDYCIMRNLSNLQVIEKWESKTNWIEFLAKNKDTRSSTSICLKIIDPWFLQLSTDSKKEILQSSG